MQALFSLFLKKFFLEGGRVAIGFSCPAAAAIYLRSAAKGGP